jgi:hypothetical protein
LLGQSVAELFAPLTAGYLMLLIGVQGVLLIDFATFLAAVAALVCVQIPRPKAQTISPGAGVASLLQEALEGWRFISRRAGLVGLLVFSGIFNFLWGMVGVLAAPLVLGFSDEAGLGALLTVAGSGLLAGGLAMSAWGRGPRRKIRAILMAEFASGLGFMLIGLRPSLILAGLGAFVAHTTIAVIGACSRTLWQQKVPAEMQGRVFAAQWSRARPPLWQLCWPVRWPNVFSSRCWLKAAG